MRTTVHSSLAILAALALLTIAPRAPAQTVWTNALSFDGVNDYVENADADQLDLTNNYTLECWFRAGEFGSLRGLVDKYQIPGANGYFLRLDGNNLDFDLMKTTNLNLQAGVWYHAAAVKDNGTRRLYVNGQEVPLTGTAITVRANTDPLRLGVDYGTRFFNGQMDEVRIWNVARSPADIQADPPLTGSESNLVAYWKFDEGSGTTVHDVTTNHFDGMLVNDPAWTNSTIPTFVNLNAGLPPVCWGSDAAWGDYDNDGRLDILLAGLSSGPTAQVWRNTGNSFSNINAGLPGVNDSSVAWGDYDHDGRLDILLTGEDLNSARIVQVWRNTGSGFANINAGLPGIDRGSVAWGDFDNDGRLDILLTGSGIAQVWRNTGTNFVNVNAGLPGVSYSSADWGDYDNDGWLDLLLTGSSITGRIAQVWRNTGSGFTNINTGLPGVDMASAAWGDYDNDGLLDILLAGWTGSSRIAQVWRNMGSGFTNINAGLPGISASSAAWGDFDNDGRLDILLAGWTDSSRIAQVWRNTGSGFVNINAGLPGVDLGSVAWGDCDNDGRLDILLTGLTGSVAIAQVWRNIGPTANTLSAAPTGLTVAVAGPAFNFSWDPASDAETPAAGLSYNLRVGTTPGGADIISPQASSAGRRRLPALGNAQQRLSFPLTFTRTGRFYWSVQAVDSAFAGSPFAPENSFNLYPVLGPESGLVPGDMNGDGAVDPGEFDIVRQQYWQSQPPQLSTLSGLGQGAVQFSVTNSGAALFTVLASTNLIDWVELPGAIEPTYQWLDPDTSEYPCRFYRLRWP